MPNRLIGETSPYLLQHAQNPVDWYPWGREALEKARSEDKPILVSIGYSACHWCHVMERESFEDEETARFMNENFVNIKIDREERPDLDHIYMDAVQAITGGGGWPLNVFLTPASKPFYGGTYFPPKRAFNRPSWKEVLGFVASAFRDKRGEINAQAENLTEHIIHANSFGLGEPADPGKIFSKTRIGEASQNLMKSADTYWGGFGAAPKFPQTFSIQFLLRYHHATKNQEALKQACLSLDKMIEGGIYDQLGGGFARYATDTEWFIPHFEKMLYDNALLVSVLSEAYQLTRKERYREVIAETIGFVQRELGHPEGGFYSALDADSEGEEGRFYCWQYGEVKKLLEEDADVFCAFFDIHEQGNWDGRNILRVKKSPEEFAAARGISVDKLNLLLERGKLALLAERKGRARPALDDKVILGWNALMNTACSKAFAATGVEEYRQLAIGNMKFLLSCFQNANEPHFHHSWKKEARGLAFLDDYAFLVQALLHLQEITGNTEWLMKARTITEYVVRNFSDGESRFFFFSDVEQRDVIVRKKEVYDGATPSGNATMAYNVYQLSILFDIPAWRERAEQMVTSIGNTAIAYPTSFGIWTSLLMEMIYGTNEIAVVGGEPTGVAKQILAEFIPNKIFMFSAMSSEKFPMLAGKSEKDIPLIYLCKTYSCLKPVTEVTALLELINSSDKNWLIMQ